MQIPAVVLTTLSSIPAATPEGLPTASKWPLLQTLGVFVGIPLAAGLVITALVVLQGAAKRPGRPGGGVAAVFTGPHAGEVDARGGDGRLSRGTGPRTETGEHSGQHREIAQPGGGGGEQGGMFSDLLSAAGEDPDLVSRAGADDGADDGAAASGQEAGGARTGVHAVGDDAGTRVGAHAVGAEGRGGETGGSGARW